VPQIDRTPILSYTSTIAEGVPSKTKTIHSRKEIEMTHSLKGLFFKKPRTRLCLLSLLAFQVLSLALLAQPGPASANKSRSKLTAEKVGPNQYNVTISVEHDGNNFLHFSDWVKLFSNGAEIQRWEYTRSKRPEAQNFQVTTTVTVTGPIVLTSLAHCNIHGSDEKNQGRLELTPE
jgi:desulfoferrodoxin (superoxide reductase-like protein)